MNTSNDLYMDARPSVPEPQKLPVSSSAILSPCGLYRYALWRTWDASKPVLGFIGLNPSTADHMVDDPTIRRCIGFGQRMGYGGILMLNCLAYRATDPKDVVWARAGGTDVVGPENDAYLTMLVPSCGRVVACWGFNGAVLLHRHEEVMAAHKGLWCFGTTVGGYPRHPLYLKGDAQLEPYN